MAPVAGRFVAYFGHMGVASEVSILMEKIGRAGKIWKSPWSRLSAGRQKLPFLETARAKKRVSIVLTPCSPNGKPTDRFDKFF